MIITTFSSYTEGYPEDEFGDSSVIHMLTGWTPYTIQLKPTLDTWDALHKFLPLWKRPEHEGKSDGGEEGKVEDTSTSKSFLSRNDYIVVGSFGSCFPNPANRPHDASVLQEMVRLQLYVLKLNMPELYCACHLS